MKRFRFPLEAVRHWRAEVVEVEQAKLRGLFGELSQLESRRQELDSERAREEREALARPALSAFDLIALDQFRQYVELEKRRLGEQAADCQRRIAEQQQRLVEARRQYRLLEKLKQRNFSQWLGQWAREQETLAAEIHLAQRARKSE